MFIRLYKGYYEYQRDRLSSSCYRLLNLPDTRRTVQRWRSLGWSVGTALIGQAGEETPYIIPSDMRKNFFAVINIMYATLASVIPES